MTCSAPSNDITVSTPDTLPSVPANFRAGTVTDSSIDFLWDSSSVNPITYFNLNGIVIDQTNPAFTSHRYTLGGLDPGTNYYHLAACNNDGCSQFTPWISVSNPLLPAAPSDLHECGVPFVWPPVELCLAGGIPVVWTSNSWNETRFELQWIQGPLQPGVNVWNTVTLPAGTTTFRLNPAPSGILLFQVRACNAGGCSDWSNLLSVTN